jgi:3-hydroxyisobutyrate dehydrogenase-like beta-hydroxyacid dehydrogenase
MEQIPGKPAAGVIGLGIIGSRVAACLRRAGHPVWLWNRTVRPEPNFLSSPAEIAEAARHIQIFVSNGEALHSVLRTMLPALTPEHVILNHATVSPADTLTAAEIVAEKHATFLDAPFTGSRDAAAAGQLVYYIGGDPQALERVRPQLEAFLMSVGRQKFVVPLYAALREQSEDRAWAEGIYKKARERYHPETQSSVDKAMGKQ